MTRTFGRHLRVALIALAIATVGICHAEEKKEPQYVAVMVDGDVVSVIEWGSTFKYPPSLIVADGQPCVGYQHGPVYDYDSHATRPATYSIYVVLPRNKVAHLADSNKAEYELWLTNLHRKLKEQE